MDATQRIEIALADALDRADPGQAPPRLVAALRHAVFPGGARVRPRLCLAVAAACGGRPNRASFAAAVALELLHCASLVHDDLPCFDDASLRRGRPSVHAAFGEPLAVLAGDALIVLAFESLGQGVAQEGAHRLAGLLAVVARAAGVPWGIVSGQAWECEPAAPTSLYHRAKTGALFAAATQAGALSVDGDARLWSALGERLGEAYQIADDIRDAAGDAEALGKPTGQDAALGRPSLALELGVRGAFGRFQQLVQAAREAIPECAGAAALRDLIAAEARRLIPEEVEEVIRRAA